MVIVFTLYMYIFSLFTVGKKKIAFGVTNHTSRLIIRDGNIRPRLYCRPCCLISAEFKTEWFPMSQTIFLYWQLCLGEIKTGRNCLQVEKSENNPAYTACNRQKYMNDNKCFVCLCVCVINQDLLIKPYICI